MSGPSTSAYADVPRSGHGPGVLVLHSWWGLTDEVKDRCNDLADAGFTALAPDLFGGRTAGSVDEGTELLASADANALAAGVSSCADALVRMPATTGSRLTVVGWSMGGSLGLWLSEREPALVAGVVSYYGSQAIDFVDATADYLFHLAPDDPMVDDEEFALLEASLGLAGREVEIHRYPGQRHFFAEAAGPTYDATAAGDAWTRTLDFLTRIAEPTP